MAIIRLIVWFILFHVGIDFWIFPNYFIDSNNPLDSFMPLLEVEKREDMFDLRMLVLRIASVAAIVYGVTEFMKEPQTLEDMQNAFGSLNSDVFEWGQNKFLGVVDDSQAIEHKKSAKEIFAEAFMDDESMFKSTQRGYADEAEMKAAYEKEMKRKAQEVLNEGYDEEDYANAAEEIEVSDSLDALMNDDDDEEDDDEEEQFADEIEVVEVTETIQEVETPIESEAVAESTNDLIEADEDTTVEVTTETT